MVFFKKLNFLQLNYRSPYIHSYTFTQTIKMNITDWRALANSGQHNKGIFISQSNPKLLKKCLLYGRDKWESASLLKDLFPDVYHIDEKNNEVIMERLEGDLTSYIYDLSAKEAAEEVKGIDVEKMLRLYNGKMPKSMLGSMFTEAQAYREYKQGEEVSKYFRNGIEKFDKFVEDIKDLKLVDVENFYALLKEKVYQKINVVWPKIEDIHKKLFERGFTYNDLKFDNYGYKIVSGEIQIMFLDPESGLFASEKEKMPKLEYFSKNGQYSFNILADKCLKIRGDFTYPPKKGIYEDVAPVVTEEVSEIISFLNHKKKISIF
jgi:hypothetical protein